MMLLPLICVIFVASAVYQNCDRSRVAKHIIGSKTRDLEPRLKKKLQKELQVNLPFGTEVRTMMVYPNNEDLRNSHYDIKVGGKDFFRVKVTDDTELGKACRITKQLWSKSLECPLY